VRCPVQVQETASGRTGFGLLHTYSRPGRSMRVAIVGDLVRRDRNDRVRLADDQRYRITLFFWL